MNPSKNAKTTGAGLQIYNSKTTEVRWRSTCNHLPV